MKILIVQDNILNESLALLDLVAYAETKGHSFDLIIEREEKNFFNKIKTYDCDLFLIPSDIGGHHWTHDIAAILKKLNSKPVVACGVYPTFYADEVVKDRNIDYLIKGEAEIPFCDLLNALENDLNVTRIKGVWGMRNGFPFKNGMSDAIVKLDEIPISKREIYFKYKFAKNFPMKKFTTGRGCYNNCSFCFNPVLKKQYKKGFPYVRRKSVSKIIEEIQYIKKNSNLKSVHFSDDIFITDEKWLEEFADKYPNTIGLRFSCNVSIDSLSKKSIDLLKKSGCRAVSTGIESGNSEIRRKVLNKEFSNDAAIYKAKLLKEKGIMVFTFNMVGLPDESISSIVESLNINYLMGTDHTRVFTAIPLPSTELFDTFEELGVLDSNKSILNLSDFAKMKGRDEYLELNKKFKRLAIIFPFIFKYPFLYKYLGLLIFYPVFYLFRVFSICFLLKEKKFFQFDFISGMMYFYHTGTPFKRTKNFVTLP